MKKLLTIIASATATMFAFADFTESGTSLENYSTNVLQTTADDFGGGGARYWYSAATDSEATFIITNYESAGVAVPALKQDVTRPDLFAPSNNASFLMIETTDDKRLFRTAQSNTQDPSAFTQVAIPDNGIYLDTLVKFTAAESAFSSDLTDGDKIAIEYVACEDDETTVENEAYTNFVIRAGYVTGGTITQTNYLAAVPEGFDPDAWHRLTVRAIPELGTTGASAGVGFVVYLDQAPLSYGLDVAPGDAAYIAKFNTIVTDNFYKENLHAIYPSIVDAATIVGKSISAVAFSGNGSVDDVVFTTTKPEFMTDTARVRVEWDANVATLALNGTAITGEDLAALSYELEPTNGVVDVVVTFASGYVAGAFTADKGGVWDASVSSFTGLVPGEVCTIKSMLPLYNVNGTNYDDLDDAIEAAQAGSSVAPATLKLLANCAEMIKFTEGYVILDLAGHDIQGTDEQAFSVVCQGAHLIVTNSVPATGAVKRPVESEDAAGAMQVKGDDGAVAIYVAKFDDIISVKPDSVAKTDIFAIYSGTFIDEDAGDDPDEFAYNDYVQGGATVTSLGNNYFQVGESGGSEPEVIAVPTAATGLVYDGTEKTGVAAGTGYTLSGTYAATNAGDYTATATLEEGYVWADTTTEAKSINWSIAADDGATVDVTLSADIAEYSAQLAFPTATATIGGNAVAGTPVWDPATITEPAAGATNTYTVTFTVTTANYAGSTGTATFKVYKEAEGGDYPSYIPTEDAV